MKRRFLASSNKPIVIGPGLDPMSIRKTGVYIYDIYGKCHDIQDWPAGYADEAAGIFVYDSGSSGYNDHVVFFVLAKGTTSSDPAVDSNMYYKNNSQRQSGGMYQGYMSVGHINNLRVHYGRVDYNGTLYVSMYDAENCRLNLTIDKGAWYNFHAYVPGIDETRLFIHMRDAINAAQTRINEPTLEQLNPEGRPVNIALSTYTNTYGMNWTTGDSEMTDVDDSFSFVCIPVYSPGLFTVPYAPGCMYVDIGVPGYMASVDIMDYSRDDMILDWYRPGRKDIFFKRLDPSGYYTWGESGVNTSNPNFTLDDAANDTSGKSNTDTLRSLSPAAGTMIDKTDPIMTRFGVTEGYVPAYGEIGQLIDDGPVFWNLKNIVGIAAPHTPSSSAIARYWSSTEVNANRGISWYLIEDVNYKVSVTKESKAKTQEYRVLQMYVQP